MKRHEWEFTYVASFVLEAAKEKRIHHDQRLAWWEKKKAKVMAEIKKRGIEVNEGLAAGYSTAQASPRVNVNVQLAADLAEAQSRITLHTQKATEYDGWVQVLERAGTADLALHADDYLFFFGS